MTLNKATESIPIPLRLRKRPVSKTGFVVPWFVTVKNAEGNWDFRAVDGRQILRAHVQARCWLCGESLGARHLAFTIGPMCAINRISAEPPAHLECAEYAVRVCPFITQPRARRNKANLPEGASQENVAGIALTRNPGVVAIWVAKSYSAERDKNGMLFRIGDPEHVSWWREGRRATRDEVMASVESGLPALEELARQDGPGGLRALRRARRTAEPIFAAIGI